MDGNAIMGMRSVLYGQPDGTPSADNKMAGSSSDMYAASATKKLNPVGEWNTAKIVYKDGKVVEFDESSEDYKSKFSQSKWSTGDYPHWNTYKEGSIALQDHGAAVWYRNIRIKKL